MSIELKLSTLFLTSAFSLFALKTSLETAIFAVVAVMLVALVIYVERLAKHSNDDLKTELRQLKDRIDGITIAKGFGR